MKMKNTVRSVETKRKLETKSASLRCNGPFMGKLQPIMFFFALKFHVSIIQSSNVIKLLLSWLIWTSQTSASTLFRLSAVLSIWKLEKCATDSIRGRFGFLVYWTYQKGSDCTSGICEGKLGVNSVKWSTDSLILIASIDGNELCWENWTLWRQNHVFSIETFI